MNKPEELWKVEDILMVSTKIEARKTVSQDATQTLASISLQNYFRMYEKLSGMTGTAETEAGELWDIYNLDVVSIPTNRPVIRKDKRTVCIKQIEKSIKQ